MMMSDELEAILRAQYDGGYDTAQEGQKLFSAIERLATDPLESQRIRGIVDAVDAETHSRTSPRRPRLAAFIVQHKGFLKRARVRRTKPAVKGSRPGSWKHRGPGLMGNSWRPGDLLLIVSGARPQILRQCPTERPRYAGLGAAILISAVMAGVSLALALVTALHVTSWIALPIAAVWGAAVLNLNRLLVVSLRHKGRPRAQLLHAIPRFLLALLVGFVISTPLVLQAFGPEIQHQITVQRDQAVARIDQTLGENPQIAEDQARYNTAITALQHANSAAAAAALKQAVSAAEQKLQADAAALRAEQQRQIDDVTAANKDNTGLLTRLQALQALTAGNAVLTAAGWLLFVLLVVIGCMPVIIKVMLNLGPESIYGRALAMEEAADLIRIEHELALQQKVRRREDEARIAEVEALLAAREAALPQIARAVAATWARIEARKQLEREANQTRRFAAKTRKAVLGAWPLRRRTRESRPNSPASSPGTTSAGKARQQHPAEERARGHPHGPGTHDDGLAQDGTQKTQPPARSARDGRRSRIKGHSPQASARLAAAAALPMSTGKSIGIWGGPSSGKTTFLAALNLAVTRSASDLAIIGADDESTDFMIESARALTNDRRFPAGTTQASAYSWIMQMPTQARGPARGKPGRPDTTSPVVPIQFSIDLREAAGEYFRSQPRPPQHRLDLGFESPAEADTPTPAARAGMVSYLAGCDGLLLVIDPLRERESGDAFEYFKGALLSTAQRLAAGPGFRLPHHVAVCITKFDHPDVYSFARLHGYRTYDANDPYLFPRVHNAEAERFFRDFCKESPSSDADLLTRALARYFHPERIRYFVTSAVGFHARGDRFHDDDYRNTVEQSDGTINIRGQIYPINVLEPVLWLGQTITTLR